MINVEIPGVVSGHVPLRILDEEPAKRAELAKTVKDLLAQGHTIVIVRGEDSQRVDGYDPETNEWVVFAHGAARKERERIPAADTAATVVPAQAGG